MLKPATAIFVQAAISCIFASVQQISDKLVLGTEICPHRQPYGHMAPVNLGMGCPPKKHQYEHG